MGRRPGIASAYRQHRRLGLAKDIGLTVCFLALLGLIAVRLGGGDEGEPANGPFHVIDGDTLARGRERLRLSGIDAPELNQICEDAQGAPWACGQVAKQALQELLARGEAECRGGEMDQYRRRLVTCTAGNENINALMVRGGMAISTTLLTYRRDQLSAEAGRRGIWQGRFDSPKSWRDHAKAQDKSWSFKALWDGTSDW